MFLVKLDISHQKNYFTAFLLLLFSCELQGVNNEVSKKIIRYTLQFFFDKGETVSKAA